MVALVPSRTAAYPAAWRRLRQRDWTPDLLLAPALLAIAAVMGFPLVYLCYMSLHKWSLIGYAAPAFVGAGNFVALLGDDRFIQSLLRTLYFTAFVRAPNLLAGAG